MEMARRIHVKFRTAAETDYECNHGGKFSIFLIVQYLTSSRASLIKYPSMTRVNSILSKVREYYNEKSLEIIPNFLKNWRHMVINSFASLYCNHLMNIAIYEHK